MADALRRDLGADVQIVDGNRGEFSVQVDGQTVSQKGTDLPSIGQVTAAVRQSQAAPTK